MPLSEAAVTGLPRSHLLKHEPRCPVNGEFCHPHCQQHLHDSEVQPGGERPRAPPGESKERVFCAAPATSQADRGGLGVPGRTGGSRAHTGPGGGPNR